MKSAIIVYSFSGNSLKFAQKLQGDGGADLIEVKEKEARSKASAYLKGTRQARSLQGVELAAPVPDLSEYESITLVFPVWAGYPAPAFNSVLPSLPEGARVTVYLSSAGGSTSQNMKDQLTTLLKGAGCEVLRITDIKGSGA